MFTGIIKETGRTISVKDLSGGREIGISCNRILKDIETGDSICVNGACLTVKRFTENSFFFDVSFSTLQATNLGDLKIGNITNLEDSLKPQDKFGGHFVTGHVDRITDILKIENFGSFYRIRFKSPPELLPFIAQKGSIAIEGISLTVEQSDDSSFSVIIIPHTFEKTNLRLKRQGDFVNLEIDLVARYIGQVIKYQDLNNIKNKNSNRDENLKEKLVEHGFFE